MNRLFIIITVLLFPLVTFADAYWEHIMYFRQTEKIPDVEGIDNKQLKGFSELLTNIIQRGKTATSDSEFKGFEVSFTRQDSTISIDLDVPIIYNGIYGFGEYPVFYYSYFSEPTYPLESNPIGSDKYEVKHEGFDLKIGYLPEQDLSPNGNLIQHFPSDSLYKVVSRYYTTDYSVLKSSLDYIQNQYNYLIINAGKKIELNDIQKALIGIAENANSMDYKQRDKINKDLSNGKINKKLLPYLEPLGILISSAARKIEEKNSLIDNYLKQGKTIEETGELVFNVPNNKEITVLQNRPDYGSSFNPQKYAEWNNINIYPSDQEKDTLYKKEVYYTTYSSNSYEIWENFPKTVLKLSNDYIDYAYMMQGWEWCTLKYPPRLSDYYNYEFKENRDKKQETFPYNIDYFQYASHPDFRFIINDNIIWENEEIPSYVFDTSGNLIRVLYHFGHDKPFSDYNGNFSMHGELLEPLHEELLKNAYNSNVLNIQSYGDEINAKIKYRLGLFLSDEEKNYIYNGPKEELYALKDKDTPNDPFYNWFSNVNQYLSTISRLTTERIDSLTFRNVYADETGKVVFETIDQYSNKNPYALPYPEMIGFVVYDKTDLSSNSEDISDIYAKIILPDYRKLILKTDHTIMDWDLDAYYWEEGEDNSLIIFADEYLSILDDFIYYGYYNDGQCWTEEWIGGEDGSDEGGLEDIGYFPDPSKGEKLVSIKFYKNRDKYRGVYNSLKRENLNSNQLTINLLLVKNGDGISYKKPKEVEVGLKSIGATLYSENKLKVEVGTDGTSMCPAVRKIYKLLDEEIELVIFKNSYELSVYSLKITFSNEESLSNFIYILKREGWTTSDSNNGYIRIGKDNFTINFDNNVAFFDDGM